MPDATRWRGDLDDLRQRPPHHLLWMCVANSARSQLAEGIARHFAPASIKISSAGSYPSFVHPQAVSILAEIGIDISDQRSKSLEAIDIDSVDTVITLCQDEVCPRFPHPTTRIHWPLPDPTAAIGGPDAILDAFRRIRDLLLERCCYLFETASNR